jgi:hypothetical protein
MLFLYCTPRPDNEVIMNDILHVGRCIDSAWIYAWKFHYICMYSQVLRIEKRHFEDVTSLRSEFGKNSAKNFLRIPFLFNLDQTELDMQTSYLMYKEFKYFKLGKYLYSANYISHSNILDNSKLETDLNYIHKFNYDSIEDRKHRVFKYQPANML